MDLISLVRGSFASDSSSISHFDVVNDQLVLAVSQVLDLESWVIRVDLLSVHVEVSWSGWVLELNIENYLLPLDTLFEVSHPLLEAVVIGNLQWSSGLIPDGLGGDLGRVIQLTVLDDQLPFLTLGNDLNPLAVRNDLHPVLPPSHGSVIFFYSNVEDSCVVFNNLLSFKCTGKGVLEFSNFHFAFGFVLAILVGKLAINDALILSGITQLS